MKKNLLFSLIVFACIGCHKDMVIPIPTPSLCNFGLCDTSKLDIVWQQPISVDTSELISVPPLFYSNNVIFARCAFGAGLDTLKLFDKKSGVLKGTWADYFSKGDLPTQTLYQSKDKFMFTTGNDVFTVNGDNLTTLWKTHLIRGNGFNWISVQYDYVYHTHSDEYISKSSNLVRSRVDFPKWDTIFSQKIIDGYVPGIECPSVWINPKGDSVALFQIRYVRFANPVSEKTDFIAYNMTQKQIYFRIDSIDRQGTVQLPYIVGNDAFASFSQSVYCFDLITKKIKWSKVIESGFGGANAYQLINKILYVKSRGNTLYALNPETGDELWEDKDAGYGNYGMAYNNGILYYTCDGSGTIVALDLTTRKKIWNEPSPNKYPNKFNGNRRFDNANIGFGGIAIDSAAGLLYTSDFYFAMCLKLPKK